MCSIAPWCLILIALKDLNPLLWSGPSGTAENHTIKLIDCIWPYYDYHSLRDCFGARLAQWLSSATSVSPLAGVAASLQPALATYDEHDSDTGLRWHN